MTFNTPSTPSVATPARFLAYEGRRPRIHPEAWIAPGVVVTGDVEVGQDASLWFGTVVRGDLESVHIGKRTNIQDLSVVHVDSGGFPTWIGEDVTIGHAARMHGCRIENGALIGIGAILLNGAVVEEGAMLAAGSLVPPGRKIPAGMLAMGSPAKVIRELSEEERQQMLRDALNYVGFSKIYKQSES